MKARGEGRQDQLLLGRMRRWAWVLVGSQSSSQHSGEGGGFGGSSTLFCICNGDNRVFFGIFFVCFLGLYQQESNIYYAAAEITSRLLQPFGSKRQTWGSKVSPKSTCCHLRKLLWLYHSLTHRYLLTKTLTRVLQTFTFTQHIPGQPPVM